MFELEIICQGGRVQISMPECEALHQALEIFMGGQKSCYVTQIVTDENLIVRRIFEK